jgi:hypothetical protein
LAALLLRIRSLKQVKYLDSLRFDKGVMPKCWTWAEINYIGTWYFLWNNYSINYIDKKNVSNRI